MKTQTGHQLCTEDNEEVPTSKNSQVNLIHHLLIFQYFCKTNALVAGYYNITLQGPTIGWATVSAFRQNVMNAYTTAPDGTLYMVQVFPCNLHFQLTFSNYINFKEYRRSIW